MKVEISSADLPITSQGRIYHLDLLPQECADTIITVGDPSRVAMVSQFFDAIEIKRQHREFITHTGRVNNTRISVVSTGIGTPNIDIVLNELDALKNIDFKTRQIHEDIKTLDIIRVGTAGGLQEDIALGEPLISRFAIGLDALLHFYQRQQSEEQCLLEEQLGLHFGNDPFLKPYITEVNDALFQRLSSHARAGITVTCPGFYAPQNRILRAQPRHTDLLERLQGFEWQGVKVGNYEMETAAIYGIGGLLQHRCISLSAVIANRITGQFSNDPQRHVTALIERVISSFD